MKNREMALTTLMMLMVLMVWAPATASAGNSTRVQRQSAVTLSTGVGVGVGVVSGAMGGYYVGHSTCTETGILSCLVPGAFGGLGGALLMGITTGAALGVGTSSSFDPRRSTGHVVAGAGVGLLAGVGGVVAASWFNDTSPLKDPGLLALPVLTSSVGALIGYAVPADLSVSLVPTGGGASAHVGFTF